MFFLNSYIIFSSSLQACIYCSALLTPWSQQAGNPSHCWYGMMSSFVLQTTSSRLLATKCCLKMYLLWCEHSRDPKSLHVQIYLKRELFVWQSNCKHGWHSCANIHVQNLFFFFFTRQRSEMLKKNKNHMTSDLAILTAQQEDGYESDNHI